jgi:DNA-binding LytR/AlgR family response regulator
MKCFTYIYKEHDEEVLIYSKERTTLVNEIESLCNSSEITIVGTNDNEIVKINPIEVACFISENNKVFALIKDKKYQIKQRLYQLEEMDFNKYYVKINQSCYANIKNIKKFESTIGGALKVIFKNDYIDYISRRELKNVKERMGL